jgi:hypothetical protein
MSVNPALGGVLKIGEVSGADELPNLLAGHG